MHAIDKYKMFTRHKGHVFLHVIWDTVNIQTLLFTDRSYFLDYKVRVITTKIMKYNRQFKRFWIHSKLQIAILVSASAAFTCYMAMLYGNGLIYGTPQQL